MNVALPLERMSSKERMTSRGKECGGSTKQKEPEKKNEKMGEERESWQLLEDGISYLYSSSVNSLIRAVGPGSRQEKEEGPRSSAILGIPRWVTMAHCASPSSQRGRLFFCDERPLTMRLRRRRPT